MLILYVLIAIVLLYSLKSINVMPPALFFCIKIYLAIWGLLRAHTIGLHLTDLKAFTCLALRQEKEPGVSNRDISGLMGRGIYTAKARSWSNILLCAAPGGQDMGVVFAPGMRVISYSGNWHQVGLLITRETSRRTHPHHPFDSLLGWRYSDLKIRTISEWARASI